MTYLCQGLWLAAVAIIATTGPAHAYLDPGTGSIILQAIIGGIAMGAVTARLYWNKILLLFKGRQPPGAGGQDSSNPAS
jgi:hypothetical protein